VQYMLLIYGDEARDAQATKEDWDAIGVAHAEFGKKYHDQIVSGEALNPTSSATTVRVRDGEQLTTDGPFAETKEQLGGFYIVKAANLDEAIAIARDIPGQSEGWNSIEVRPVMEFGEE
jgi:hypothetical protein